MNPELNLPKSIISTNYAKALDDGSVIMFAYDHRGVVEKKLNRNTEYRGDLYIVTDGSCAMHNFKMWLYHSSGFKIACDIHDEHHEGRTVYKVSPIGDAEPYELDVAVGTMLGVKDGLPVEVDFDHPYVQK